MANATVKTKEVTTGLTLELDHQEAVYLAALLGRVKTNMVTDEGTVSILSVIPSIIKKEARETINVITGGSNIQLKRRPL